MRKLVLLFVALAATAPLAFGQTTTSDSQWAKVQQLKTGQTLHIKTTHGKIGCRFTSADASSLTCSGGSTIVTQRADIRSISISHRGRSALVGAAIGGGAGAAAGAGVGRSGDIIGKGGVAALFGIPLAIIGGVVGVTTDFTHGTIYRN